MFPSALIPRKAIREFFANAVRDANTGLPLLAVAAQRLSSWDKGEARAACRDAYKRASTPHARRILALSALEAGESRTKVKSWLSADSENAPTLRCWTPSAGRAQRLKSISQAESIVRRAWGLVMSIARAHFYVAVSRHPRCGDRLPCTG